MKVFASKNLALAGIALAGVMGFAQSSLAYTPLSSTANLAGPGNTNLTVFGQSFPCISRFYVDIDASGNAKVKSATFSAGSAVCPYITFNGSSWPLSAATLVSPGVYRAEITNISVTVAQVGGSPIIATCVSDATHRIFGQIDQNFTPHRFTFSGNLVTTAPVVGQNCAVSTVGTAYLPTSITAP